MPPLKGKPNVTRPTWLVSASVAAVAFGLLTPTAHADFSRAPGGVRVSGGVRIGGGFSAGVHGGWRATWGGGVRVYSRPYYAYQPYYNYYQPVPSYYGYVEGVAAPGITAVVVAQPPLPRFGLGLFAGGLVTTNTSANGSVDTQGSDFGLLGRLRLTTGLLLEGDLGKTHSLTSTSVNGVDVTRVDRRFGGSLVYEFGAYNRWSPYILAGLGAEQTDLGSSYSATRAYGEIGGGIRFAVTEHFHLTADLRVGARDTTSASDTPVPATLARTIYPTEPTTYYNGQENYVRSRLSAILWF